MNSASQASAFNDQRGDDRWMSIHHHYLVEAWEQEPEILFIGDYLVALASQTEGFNSFLRKESLLVSLPIFHAKVMQKVWEKLFVPMHCLNFGIAEDQTQNILWRIENGEIDAVNPKVVVLSAGANNIHHTIEQIVEGIHACDNAIRNKKPNAMIVILELMPCGQHPNSLRTKILEVNKSLYKVKNWSQNSQVVNIDPGFIQPDGSISHHDMYDYLHLTKTAYYRSFEILADLLLQLLSEHTPELAITYE